MKDIEIIVGTYENLLIGYKLAKSFANKNYALETSFTDDSHRGALRCVAVSKAGILASSSTDDSIRLHSLKKRKEIGGLFEHKGTVNSMVFFDKNHMFSASEDGTVCLWHSKNWELMRTLKGHKSHVMGVAIHPSGKLGLSVGSDRSFITWDLVTGKLAFQRKLSDAAQSVYFTSEGNHYILVYHKKLEVCSLEDTKVVKEIPTEWRINAVCHVNDNIFAVGGDDRHVQLFDVLKGKQVATLDAAKSAEDDFKSRVRCISVVDHDGEKLLFLATASGDIQAFKLDLQKGNVESKSIFFGEARVRVTSMSVYSSSVNTVEPVKQKVTVDESTLEEGQDNEDDDDSDVNDASDSNSDNTSNSSPAQAKKRKREDVSGKMKKKKSKKMLPDSVNKKHKSVKKEGTVVNSEVKVAKTKKAKRKSK